MSKESLPQPTVTVNEVHATNVVLEAGAAYGYGNMIAHLKKAWAESLMDNYSFTGEQALRAADTSAYPLKRSK